MSTLAPVRAGQTGAWPRNPAYPRAMTAVRIVATPPPSLYVLEGELAMTAGPTGCVALRSRDRS